jgi:hypothetical protein
MITPRGIDHLRTSTDPADYERSAWASMPVVVWWELLRDHPDMRLRGC